MSNHALIGECLEEDVELKKRFRGLKWIGVFILTVLCTVPGIVVIIESVPPRPSESSPSPPEIRPNLNQTACVYVKQYPLRGNVYGTLCNQNGLIFLDIRRFINGTATPIGIQLDLHQWLTLKQLTSLIDKAISEARTYWRTLKTV